mgnify:CR=1 FL=1
MNIPRLAESVRVVTISPFPLYRFTVPEIPCKPFPMNRDSVPHVPCAVPEIPCRTLQQAGLTNSVKRVLLSPNLPVFRGFRPL